MTVAQKFTIAGRLRRGIIDLAQAGNYVERGNTIKAIRNIETAVDHLTEALGAIRKAEGIPKRGASKRGTAKRKPNPKSVPFDSIRVEPRAVLTGILGAIEHNVHVGPPNAGDPIWGTARSPWLSCGCGKKDLRGRRVIKLAGQEHHPGHAKHSAWHRKLGAAYARGLGLYKKPKRAAKTTKKSNGQIAAAWWKTQ